MLKKLWIIPLVAAAGIAAWMMGPQDTAQQDPAFAKVDLEDYRPLVHPNDGYTSSKSCRECHEHQHDTWHRSYHRSMTQVASAETVIGDFDDATFTNRASGAVYRMRTHSGRHWVEFVKPEAKLPDGYGGQELPIVMTTGSHHMQMYWFGTMQGRTLGMIPAAYLRKEQRWISRDAAFLKERPNWDNLEIGRWNTICIRCHATHGRIIKTGADHFETEVTELGISCEACHGPADEHVRLRRGAKGKELANDPIVNPADLPAAESAQVCGGCHTVHRTTGYADLTDWKPYRVGTRTDPWRLPLRRSEESIQQILKLSQSPDPEHQRKQIEAGLDEYFWSDGMVRVSGREYNGLLETPCHIKGEMSCLSCHDLHQRKSDARPPKEWANDQLHSEFLGDRACTQCHDAKRFAAKTHTHHLEGSSGSSCYNCHMPHTTYGLMKAMRSHTVDSPSARNSVETGRPNACNLCHLDRSLAWTAGHLKSWYGHNEPVLSGDQREVAASVVWGLNGDAGQRALIAWHYGWEPALDASGRSWPPLVLSYLLDDAYDTVRFIAGRSLRQLPAYQALSYDFDGPREHRKAVGRETMAIWNRNRPDRFPSAQAVLIRPDGSPDLDRLGQLLAGAESAEGVLG